jgi:FMN phosphatase YigB (HAD superfamily)
MNKTIAILLDLDDTLLGNDMDQFLPGYLHSLAKFIPDIPEKLLIKELMIGTKKMITKTTAALTLAEVFNDYFYPAIGKEPRLLANQINKYYQDEFPKLTGLTTQKQEAITLVEEIHRIGHPMVVATNPLFPSAAQFHRLAWAGFPAPDGLFYDVTSFENYHFCKPNPEYYAEIIFKYNFMNMPVVMVGNSLMDDILPAEKLGLSTFWVNPDDNKHPSQGPLSTAGEICDVLPWIQSIIDKITPIQWNSTLEQSIITLNVTPAVFDSYRQNLPFDHLVKKPAPEEWSIHEVLQHLLDADNHLNLARIQKFYSEDKPFITSLDLDDLPNKQPNSAHTYQEVLTNFLSIRTDLLDLINTASAEIRDKNAVHAIFGPTTFREIIEFIAIHDRNHIQQCNHGLTISQ